MKKVVKKVVEVEKEEVMTPTEMKADMKKDKKIMKGKKSTISNLKKQGGTMMFYGKSR